MKLGEMFLSFEVLAERFLAPGHAWQIRYINKDSDIDKINQFLHERWKQHCPTLVSAPNNFLAVE
jgi:hypothetical protein